MSINKKGQGALEYLLLLGGAVLVAAIVLSLVTALATTGKGAASSRINDAICAPIPLGECGDKYTDSDGTGPLPATLTSIGKDPDGTEPLGSNACKVRGGTCVGCSLYDQTLNKCNDT